MAYNETLANRIREYFVDHLQFNFEEKRMMGGLTFMLNGKMCVGVFKQDLMCRIDPEQHEQAIEQNGCKTMEFNNRGMHGYVLVDEMVLNKKETFDYWMQLSIEFNPKAKASKKKNKK
ncbi:MAG: TfoX/Sxy family protein [bacterium]|nr:TfoX/Sxy family protein [bacterium]